MTNFLGFMRKEDVMDAKTFAQYLQQKVGTPYPTGVGMTILRKHIKELFAQYPQADYQTLVRIVEWVLAKKKKYANAHSVVAAYRYAWRDGYLPELNPNPTRELDEAIDRALDIETDMDWRRLLVQTVHPEDRASVYKDWLRKEAENNGVPA